MINGLQVGAVYKFEEKTKNLADGIVVTINMNKELQIPKNSYATISSDLLGTTTMNIELGDDISNSLKDGDTVITRSALGVIDNFKKTLDPALLKLDGTLASLDSLLEVVGGYFDPKTKNNFHAIIGNLSKSTASLQILLNDQTGTLAKSLDNVNTFTGNLAKNNEKIDHTLGNLEKASDKYCKP
jgi:phospholipid/cholesterol/gamma-HCH transport system substrate-binding protein